jgi:LysM repeat protein
MLSLILSGFLFSEVAMPSIPHASPVRDLELLTKQKNESDRADRGMVANPQETIYVVKPGDSLSEIAANYHVSSQMLMAANQMKRSVLVIGQKLRIPGRSTATRASVRPGSITTGKITVVPRRQWAVLPIKGNIDAMGRVNKITVHHTSGAEALKTKTDFAFLRSVEENHLTKRKWACIAYHYIIGRDGTVYEGRPISFQGAHAHSHNPNNLGIAMMGDFDKAMPNAIQLQSLDHLLGALRTKYRLPPRMVYGHLCKTECPGTALKAWLDRYRLRNK